MLKQTYIRVLRSVPNHIKTGVSVMKSVFLLQHGYEAGEIEGTKIIGIFSSRETAEQMRIKYKSLPGFKNYPDSFFIDEYTIDKSYWEEGF